MYFRIIIAAVLAALLHAGTARAQPIKAGTTWVNQFESTLTIDTLDAESGALKGNYISRLGQYCTGTKHDAVGWVDGDRVVFSVRWKTSAADCKSITSWAGYVVNGKIVAFWDLVYVSPVDGSNFVHRGTDIFEPCAGGKPKGCPQQAATDEPRSSEQEAARVAAEQRARAAAEAKRKEEEAARAAETARAEAKRRAEEEAARAAAEQRARAEAETRRKAEEEARVAEAGRIGVDARRLAEAGEAALKLSSRDRRRVQAALTALGFDTQGIDEVFGPRTRQMIAAWQKRQGAPETGFLTAPQYAALQRQAAAALARFDAIDKQNEARRKAAEDEQRRTIEVGDSQEAQPQVPPQVAATAPAGASDAPTAPRQEQYKGFSRILLYDGSDPKAFAEYTLTVTVTDGRVSAVVTRYCPACVNEGSEERKTFTCATERLRGRSYNLKCEDVFTWGNFERARVHYSTTHVDIPLVRVSGPGG